MSREIRDTIHGYIERSEIEERIINTRPFQRLRGIKQLALASLVYPGALHTRFEHSIGVMHIAGKIAKKFHIDNEDYEIIRLAALMHDLGHGPFSHVSEGLLSKYSAKKFKKIKQNKIHELITWDIIKNDKEIRGILPSYKIEKIINLLSATESNPLHKGIVSGPLDADKQDYLLRDSYYSGVKYGIYDFERLLNCLNKIEDIDKKSLAVSSDGIHALEQFVIAKYHMSTQVYGHKIRLITDNMITRALKLGVEVDKISWLNELYSYDGTSKFIKNYLKYDDQFLINKILDAETNSGYAKTIFNQLKYRELFKKIYSKKLNDLDATVSFCLFDQILSFDYLNQLESEIAQYISKSLRKKVDHNLVIVNQISIKSVRIESRDDEGTILIIGEDNTKKWFENESTLFHSINAEESLQLLEVYAPVQFENIENKKQMMKSFETEITKIINMISKSFEKSVSEEIV